MNTPCTTCRYRHNIKGNHTSSPCTNCDPESVFEFAWRHVPGIMRPLYWVLDRMVAWMEKVEDNWTEDEEE